MRPLHGGATPGISPSSTWAEFSSFRHDPDDVHLTASDSASKLAIQYISGWKLVAVMTGITLTCFLVLLDVSILVTAIPSITTDFHSLFDIGWYGSAYNLASCALQPLSGKLYTYLSAKWTFLSFFFIFEAGSLICALAGSSNVFIVGRAVSGIGASGLQNGALTIIAACAPLERRPILTGIMIGLGQVGLVAGPLLGGAITEYSTWRWCFYINLPVGVICAVILVFTKIPDMRRHQRKYVGGLTLSKLDLPGFFMFAPFAIMTLLALQYGGNDYPWKSATVIGLFCGGGIALIVFMAWEAYVGDDAMIPISIVRKRQVWTSCLVMLTLFGTIIATSYYMAIYFQAVKGMTPFNSGVSMLPLILSQVVGALLAGVYVQKAGYYIVAMVAGATIATIGNGLLSTLSPDSPTTSWAGFQILAGLGRGLTFQIPILATQAHTPPDVTALATATLVFCQTFGGAIFIGAANSIFSNKLKDELVRRLPMIDPDRIVGAGATGLDKIIPSQILPTVLEAYSKAIGSVFYLVVAGSGCLFVVCWGMGFTDVRRKGLKGADH